VAERIEALLQDIPALRNRVVAVVPLSGGITNRNYRVFTDAGSVVLRLGGEHTELLGIDRDCEHSCSSAAAACGVGARVIAYLPHVPALVTEFLPGKVGEPEDARHPDTLRRMVAALRCYHDGPPGAGRFSPFATVRQYYSLAREHDVQFPPEMSVALALLESVEATLGSGDPLCPCHNDLLPANFIDDGETVRIIDWEYAGMGDRFFDLGNLAVNHGFDEELEEQLLALYFGAVRPEHVLRLRLMRVASDLRESLWGYLQSAISTLDFDFLTYGRSHLDRSLAAAGTPAEMDRAPVVSPAP
jgi:thiamine kinase-like enzyme